MKNLILKITLLILVIGALVLQTAVTFHIGGEWPMMGRILIKAFAILWNAMMISCLHKMFEGMKQGDLKWKNYPLAAVITAGLATLSTGSMVFPAVLQMWGMCANLVTTLIFCVIAEVEVEIAWKKFRGIAPVTLN